MVMIKWLLYRGDDCVVINVVIKLWSGDFVWYDSNTLFIIHPIILFDIASLLLLFPLPWEMGRYSRIAAEVRDSFMESLCCFIANQEGLALIRNTRGDERSLFYIVIVSVVDFKLISLKYFVVWSWFSWIKIWCHLKLKIVNLLLNYKSCFILKTNLCCYRFIRALCVMYLFYMRVNEVVFKK